MVKGESPIRTAADLAGKTVAVNTLKNINDTTVRQSVRKAGGDASSIKFVELPFPDMLAALASGRVQAAQVVEPFLSAAKAQGARVVANNYVDTAPNLIVAGYFTSGKAAKSNPDLVQRFVAAMNESLQYANSHPDEVRAIVPMHTKISAADAAKLTLPSWPTSIDPASVQILADLAKQDGLLKEAPDISAILP